MPKSPEQPTSSKTTGFPDPETLPSSIGREPGGPGSLRLLPVSDETARGWLLAQGGPEEADKALLASLKSQLNVGATFRTELRFPEGRPTYSVVVGCDLALTDPEQRAKAIARMEGAQVGPTKTQAEDWLIMLEASCSSARKGDVSKVIQFEVYAGTLARFPADVAKQACVNLALRTGRDGGWFPSLADLNAECERLAGPRLAVLAALRNWRPPSPEEARREAVRERLFRAKEMEDEAHLLKRSDPERHAQLTADVKALRNEADALRRGEIER